MPELPEVETVRSGLAEKVLGARIAKVTVNENRSIRQHVNGATDFCNQLKVIRLFPLHVVENFSG